MLEIMCGQTESPTSLYVNVMISARQKVTHKGCLLKCCTCFQLDSFAPIQKQQNKMYFFCGFFFHQQHFHKRNKFLYANRKPLIRAERKENPKMILTHDYQLDNKMKHRINIFAKHFSTSFVEYRMRISSWIASQSVLSMFWNHLLFFCFKFQCRFHSVAHIEHVLIGTVLHT